MKKHEREIRELLEKMDNFLPDSPPGDRGERETKKKVVSVMPPAPKPIPIRPSKQPRLASWLKAHRVNAGLAYIMGGFTLVICGLIVWQNFPGLHWLAQGLVAAGALVYLIPVLARFFTGRNVSDDTDSTKYWRGETVEDGGFSWQSVRQWFGGRKKSASRNPWNDRNRGKRF